MLNEYLVLVDNIPFTKIEAISIEDALSYVNSRYSFEGCDGYIVVTPI